MGMDYSLVQRIIDGLGKILDTKPGSPDEGTYVTEQQLADWIKGQTFVTGYYYNGAFYSDSAHTTLITPQANVLYADLGAYGLYAWDGAAYQPFTPDLTPYATKAEVQAADANLQSQVTSLQKQIDNITEAESLLSDVDYANGETAVPANVSENAEVSVLKGVGRIGNNIFDASDNPQAVRQGVTVGYDGNYITLNGTATGDESISGWFGLYYTTGFSGKAGHRVVIALVIASGTITGSLTGLLNSVTISQSSPVGLVTLTANSIFSLRFTEGTVFNNVKVALPCRDLTLYFNGSIPSNAQTIAQIQQNYPELLEPSDYGTEAVFPTYTAVKSVGRNIFDDELEYGELDIETGLPIRDTSSSRMRSINFMPANPSTDYYGYFGSISTRTYALLFCYDINKNYLGYISTGIANAVNTTLANTKFIKFYMLASSNTHDICISVSDSQNGTYTPYMTDTLTLPVPVTLKGAGSVSEEYYPESGEVTHPLRTITLNGSENWYEYTGAGSGYAGAALNVGELAKSRVDIINNRGYLPQATPSDSTRRGITTINSQLYVTFPTTEYATWSDFVASLASNPLVVTYALATPNPSTFVTPIIDPYIKVEPNGTIETVQSQSPKVDGAMTVTYTNKLSA